jgi:DNA-binding transcriptional LysR family regulator
MARIDVAAACAAFVSVAQHESFSQGAAALRIPQSVASRRVANLERLLGAALLERTTKRVALTRFGRELMPRAAALAAGPDALMEEAADLLARPVLVAFPALCHPLDLAKVTLACRDTGEAISACVGDPNVRARLLAEGRATYSVEPAAPDEATWTTPLGVISRLPAPHGVRYLDTLRPSRADRGRVPVLWVHPEDDVPHVRDRLTVLRNSVGLGPSQIRVARDLPEALVGVLATDDLLLGSRKQASDLGLAWAQIGELHLTRGYRIAAVDAVPGAIFFERCAEAIADCLGARSASRVRERGCE